MYKINFSHWMKPFFSITALLVVALVALSIGSSKATAACKNISGHSNSIVEDTNTCGSTSNPPICLSGSASGSKISGTFTEKFIFISLNPVDPDTPSVFFFVSENTFVTKKGTLFGINAGTVDFDQSGDGHFASLITWTGGTGDYVDASGHSVLDGMNDFAAGTLENTFNGEVCTP